MTPAERTIFCRIVGTLLVSDLKLHDSEARYLEELYQRLGVNAEEQRAIERSINVDDDLKELARALSPNARLELLEELRRAAWADGLLMKSEATIIVAIEELLA